MTNGLSRLQTHADWHFHQITYKNTPNELITPAIEVKRTFSFPFGFGSVPKKASYPAAHESRDCN
jgi:hypothetical protein